MNRSKFDAAVSWVCGVFGFGGVQVTGHWTSEVLKFAISMLTAFVAGFLGYAGQQFYKYLKNKYYGRDKTNI